MMPVDDFFWNKDKIVAKIEHNEKGVGK